MDATWEQGDDYHIRLRPVGNYTQEKLEQEIIIHIMQLIRQKGVRIVSYGSWKGVKQTILNDKLTELQEEMGRLSMMPVESLEEKQEVLEKSSQLSMDILKLQEWIGE